MFMRISVYADSKFFGVTIRRLQNLSAGALLALIVIGQSCAFAQWRRLNNSTEAAPGQELLGTRQTFDLQVNFWTEFFIQNYFIMFLSCMIFFKTFFGFQICFQNFIEELNFFFGFPDFYPRSFMAPRFFPNRFLGFPIFLRGFRAFLTFFR